ncbi:MAG: GDP-mannose 4,6-dehydratase [Candidatus Omnitrophica bacterium]|nr:GDP-mannose 4,6-dehydratase [Candidatus Omnitrophota bacterium]
MDLKGKKILVTGAEGFIGSHLTEALIGLGCDVKAMVLYNFMGSYGWLETACSAGDAGPDVFMGDVRDINSVREAMKGVDVVFHLAALIGIPYSYCSPESYVDTNVKGTLNVLQAARDAGVDKVLVTSTSEVYGTAISVPMSEGHPRQGQSPYSATKIGADALAESFYRSFGLPVAIVRPFNTYGPRQSARAIIPTVVTQILSGKKEIELGALHPTRDLVYVKDTVNGFIAIAASDRTIGEEINIATGEEISIGELADKIREITGSSAIIRKARERTRPEKSEVERLVGDPAKLKDLTGWGPGYTLEKGLRATIEWFGREENIACYRRDGYVV